MTTAAVDLPVARLSFPTGWTLFPSDLDGFEAGLAHLLPGFEESSSEVRRDLDPAVTKLADTLRRHGVLLTAVRSQLVDVEGTPALMSAMCAAVIGPARREASSEPAERADPAPPSGPAALFETPIDAPLELRHFGWWLPNGRSLTLSFLMTKGPWRDAFLAQFAQIAGSLEIPAAP